MTVTICSDAHAGTAPQKASEPRDAEAVTGYDTPEGNPSQTPLPKDESEETSMPPNLEAFISREYLPDFIDINVGRFHDMGVPGPDACSWKQFIAQYPVRFERKYPRRTPVDNGNESNSSVAQDRPTVGQLDFRHSKFLGNGSHSEVLLAPLTLPSTAASSSTRGAVAVKFTRSRHSGPDLDMLENEAKIYNAFPRELQEGSSRAAPVVPKFYGYYVPALEEFDSYTDGGKFSKEEWLAIRWTFKNVTPVLLLEPCGKHIRARALSPKNRSKIVTLARRLHKASFVQGSFYERNILVQPGPLTLPPVERSPDYPSYRIIDFGRGQCPSVNNMSIEAIHYEAKYERDINT